MTTQILLKIPFVGDGGVGKTSIVSRLIEESFSQSYLMTIGAIFFVKKMKIDQIEVGVQLNYGERVEPMRRYHHR